MVDTAARSKNRELLLNIAPLAEETAGRYDHALYLGIAHRGWGVLHHLNGDYSQALDRLENAEALFKSLGTRWQLGRTLVSIGEVRADQQEIAAAAEKLQAAASLFDEIHAAQDGKRARRLLAGLSKTS